MCIYTHMHINPDAHYKTRCYTNSSRGNKVGLLQQITKNKNSHYRDGTHSRTEQTEGIEGTQRVGRATSLKAGGVQSKRSLAGEQKWDLDRQRDRDSYPSLQPKPVTR